MSGVRVDVWMWSVRLFKSRSASTAACRRGVIRVNGSVTKASRTVEPGDQISARVAGRQRMVEVVVLHKKRVGAPVAAEALIDNSPPPDPRPTAHATPAVRERGAGRPTKRDRRKMQEFTSFEE